MKKQLTNADKERIARQSARELEEMLDNREWF